MWNVSALSMPQTLTCKMTGEVAILLTLMMIGLHSAQSLAEAAALVIEPELPINCRLVKCSAGYHSVCQSNGQPRCKVCSDGFYSSHASRKTTCRRCSHCEDNEFEIHPCSSTSDVVCQRCRECSSRSEFVLKSCTRTSDTICGNCSSVLGLGCEKEQNPRDFSSHHKDRPGSVKHHAWTKRKFHVEEIPIQIRVQPTLQSSTIILHSSIAVGKVPTAFKHHSWTKKKVHVEEIPIEIRVQPTLQSSTIILHSSIAVGKVPTTFVNYHDHIESSTRSTLETGKAVDPLTQAKSQTRTLGPASNPSTTKNETAVYSDSGKAMRNRRWQAINKTRNMTEVLSLPKYISPEPSDPPSVEVIVSPHFDRDKTTTPYEFSPSTTSNTVGKAPFDMETSGPPLKTDQMLIATFVISGILAIVLIVSLLLAKMVKKRTLAQQGFHGHLSSQAEHRTWRPRCPQSRNCCVSGSVSSIAARNADQIKVQGTRALNGFDSDDSPPSSTQVTVISYLSEEVKPVYNIFPKDQRIRSELLFVTSAHDIFDNNGGKLTHPDSDICINIEPGTFPDGKKQPIDFHVIYDDTYVIRDIPETNKRTLISPVIKCGPEDIHPQKAVEIVLPHCLYVDEVKKGSIEVYRCGQYTSEGAQKWEKIPSSSEKGHSKAWFSVKKDCIVIKTKIFSIWSVFVCGAGGSKRKRITAFTSKPNPASNLIFLRCYIYSDNEDSKRKVERLEKDRFPGTKPASLEKPFKLYSDDQDINVWLDEDALTRNGWMLDAGICASQIYSYEMAYKNGFRSKYACEFPVKPIADCLFGVEDFSCALYFQQIGHAKDLIYVNPGIPLLPLQTTVDVSGSNSYEAQSQNLSGQASNPVISSDSSTFVIPEDLRSCFDEPVTRQDCTRLCNHIVNDWKMILRHLGVEEAVLDNVDANHSRANEKSYQGLLEWTRSAGTQGATIRNLCNALRAVNCTEAIEKLSSRDDGARLPTHAIPETV